MTKEPKVFTYHLLWIQPASHSLLQSSNIINFMIDFLDEGYPES